MRINYLAGITALLTALPSVSWAMDADDHDPQAFHAMQLEMDAGATRHGVLYSWDLDGWIGGDVHKLWLRSEGEKLEGESTEQAEFWAMYSHNISTFWDAQAGIRHDTQPDATTYFVAGFNGLAPYSFETEAHLFLSEDGDVTARLKQEKDFLITQKLISQPYAEFHFSAQDVPELELGTGITNGEIGIQSRYEVTRKFAPYIDLRYDFKVGETASIAQDNGESRDEAIASVGLRLMF